MDISELSEWLQSEGLDLLPDALKSSYDFLIQQGIDNPSTNGVIYLAFLKAANPELSENQLMQLVFHPSKWWKNFRCSVFLDCPCPPFFSEYL